MADRQGVPRRQFLASAGAAAATLAAAGAVAAPNQKRSRRAQDSEAPAELPEGTPRDRVTGPTRSDPFQDLPPAAGGPVQAFFGPYGPGTRLGRWTLVAVHDVSCGAIPVVLRAAGGRPFQVDILRRVPGGPAGIAETPSLSLFLANSGSGSRRTVESHGLGVMALGQLLAQREAAGARPPALLSLAERSAAHAGKILSVLV